MNKIPTFEAPASVTDVTAAVSQSGVCVINGYVEDGGIPRESLDALLTGTLAKDYPYGKVVRELGSELQPHIPHIFSLIAGRFPRELSSLFGTPRLDAVFLTHDFRNDQGIAANGYLHFDKIPTLKFMLYLTDCEASSGAFSCIPGSHTLGRRLRLENSDNNRIAESNSPFSYLHEMIEPINGPAGTFIVFHTDILHCGGRVEDGRERIVARSHFR
ncbi:MAG TPA: hypothetical protein EYQ00_10115 [Dehalococcoidia bacterium]|nr:hypothetical protein [Dehalococcoidia bacterium]